MYFQSPQQTTHYQQITFILIRIFLGLQYFSAYKLLTNSYQSIIFFRFLIISVKKIVYFCDLNKQKNKMKKTLLTLLSSFALFSYANAQVSAYSFATSSGTYTAITGGSVLGTTTNDEQLFVDPSALTGGSTASGVGFPIGFSFTYNGIVFDRVAVCSNGWISLGQSSLTPSVNLSSSSYYNLPLSVSSSASPSLLRNRIGGLALDLQGQTGSELRIQTIGSAPNRVCVVQWTNYKKYLASNGSFSFQIRLNETTNNIEVVYGTTTPPTSQFTAQVGLSGTTASDFNIRKTAGSSWTSTSAGSVNTDTCRVSATVYPASGLVFAWTPAPACTGTPVAGTASSSVSSVCSGISFDLTLTGYTSNASGITFQWQSASSLGGTYTNISGATSTTYSASQTATTYYKCVVTCSGSSSTSNVVTVAINAPNACYCTPASGGGACITNVTIGSLNKTSAACENAPEYYTSVPVGTATTTINQATTYPISVTNGTGSAAIISVWIDYNQNGTYESSEWVQVATNATASSTSTVNVVVPSNATLGQTGMRVRSRAVGSPNGATDACTDFFSGEVEDYVVTIGAGTPCTGAPVAGTASSSTDSTCAVDNFDLTLTGYSSGVSGITFQWQSSSTMGGTYTNILGATNPNYTATQSATTYYKCVVTCSGTSSSSNVVSVINNPFSDCYCVSQVSNVKDEEIANVTVGTLNNSSSCAQTGGLGSILSKYSNYTTLVAAPILAAGSTVNFSVQIDTCNPTSLTVLYSNAIKIFIDYNQNGSFADTLEMVYVSDTAKGPQTITGTFVVPSVATNGNTRMRIVSLETTTASSISSCGSTGYGETEDYTVNITGGVNPNVGIEENAVFNNVSIYPNPSTGLFNIVATNVKAETITVQVLDLQGKVVYSASDKAVSSSYNKSINLEGLAKGLYYIKLNSENGSKVQKIVIQ